MEKKIKSLRNVLFVVSSFVLVFGILACKNDKGTKGDPELILKELKYKGGDDFSSTLKLEVDPAVETLAPSDFTAKFDYGTTKGVSITLDSVELPKGQTKLQEGKNIVTLKVKGVTGKWRDFEKKISVSQKGASTFTVKLKRKEDETPIALQQGTTIETTQEETDLIIESSDKMTLVKLAGQEVALTNEGKVANAKVKPGAVNLEVTLQGAKPVSFAFTLTKVADGQLPIRCLSAKLVLGKNNTRNVEFDKDRVAKWTAKAGEIQYSFVTIALDMDTKLSSRKVKCTDERSATYATAPTDKDLKGIYSGYVTQVKSVDEAKSKAAKSLVLKTQRRQQITNNKYVEVVIVGAGKVVYEIEFEAAGRKSTTYKIEITNENEEKLNVAYTADGKIGYPELRVENFIGTSILGNIKPAFHLPFYHQGPLFKVNAKDEVEDFQKASLEGDLEVMDDLIMEINQTAETEAYKKDGNILFFYNVYEDVNNKEFTVIDPHSYFPGDKDDIVRDYVGLRENVVGKHFDAFITARKYLPQGLHPIYTAKKWKRIAQNGFLVEAFVENKELAFSQALSYRQQAYYIKEAQVAGAANTKELKVSKKMKWTDWYSGKTMSTTDSKNPKTTLYGKGKGDLFTAYATFDSLESAQVFFTISVSEDGTTWQVDAKCNDLKSQGRKTPFGDVFYMPCITDNVQNTTEKAYRFKEKNEAGKELVYKVEMKVTVGANTNKYIYILDYRGDQPESTIAPKNVGQIQGRTISTAYRLFGVPLSFYK